jgi:hypothetical protein
MFRFTIRDVLWLTVVVGMGAAWYVDARRREAGVEAAAASVADTEFRFDLVRSEAKKASDDAKVRYDSLLRRYKQERDRANVLEKAAAE